jgi:lysozyme
MNSRSLRLLTVGVTLAVASCSAPPAAETVGVTSQASTTVCGAPTNGPIQGVDISHYQGSFDWASAKAGGTVFGYASIGDGTGYADPDFGANWANMKAAGVLRGAYEYFEPGDDPTAQANLMIQAVGQLGSGDLPCMVDVETTGGQSGATIAANVRTWLDAVQAGTGKIPIIYTGPSFWDGSVGSTAFGATPLWVADYGPSCPAVPNGWSNWVIWQYGDSGGSLDQDVFNGTLAQLTALGQTAPACTNQCSTSARVGIAAAPTGQGYWIVDSAGHIYPNGNASFFGDLTGVTLAQPVVGIAATPSGQGYWLVAADGGVFAFGSARFLGAAT